MASDDPSPYSPSLRLSRTVPQPSTRCHAQTLLGPSFHESRTPHVLESHPEQAAPLSRRDSLPPWQWATTCSRSYSNLAQRLYLAACNPSSNCHFWVLDHPCSNQVVSIVSLLLNHGNPIFEPVCVFYTGVVDWSMSFFSTGRSVTVDIDIDGRSTYARIRSISIDRRSIDGRHRHRPSIHLRENTVDMDLDRRSTYGRYRHRPSIHLRGNTVDPWLSIKYRDNFFGRSLLFTVTSLSALHQTRHKNKNNTQQLRQQWTNGQECLKQSQQFSQNNTVE